MYYIACYNVVQIVHITTSQYRTSRRRERHVPHITKNSSAYRRLRHATWHRGRMLSTRRSSQAVVKSVSDIERGSSHDPSIVEANGKYYIFGSHRAWLKSDDLVNWEPFTNNLSTQFKDILGDFWEEWPKQPANSDLTGNMWAPDVIYNKAMKKWCMYMSVNGINYKSAIVLLTADDIEGDWTLVGPVVYSGFRNDTVSKTDVPQVLDSNEVPTRYLSPGDTEINAIDPA